MSSFIMQVSIPKPTHCLRNSDKNLAKLRGRVVSSTATTATRRRLVVARCSLETGRRSGNYQAAIWDFDSIQSLNTEYKEDRHLTRAAGLIAQVKMLVMKQELDVVSQLELIDHLQRLGISCHFDNQITQILNFTYLNIKYITNQRDLYSIALQFRLLRQHGFRVSQEVFDCFKNEEGSDFKASLGPDIKGLLQLYEASFLLTHGETTLELAREFATKTLQKKLDDHEGDQIDDNLLSSIQSALEFPIHWQVQIPNARSYIDAYKRRPDMNPVVLELAKLDINIVQAQLQEELKQISRWWEGTCLVQQLPFVRDRIVECYFWTTGVLHRRQHGFERIMITKIFALVTVIDDVFDIYGTLEELQLFTTAIQRWDIESLKQLPPYMQLCYLAVHNFVHETAYDTLKDKDFNSIPYLRKAWQDLIEAYMKEAKWYYNGHKPSMEEYMNNAWISIGALPILSHLFFQLTDSIEMEGVERMHEYHEMVRASCIITRLADDMGTILDEVERGDVPKSLECYMSEKNWSEEEARKHVKSVIEETWKTMNGEMMSMRGRGSDSPFSKYYVEAVANLARTAQFIYQDESDGFGMQHSTVNQVLRGLLVESYA